MQCPAVGGMQITLPKNRYLTHEEFRVCNPRETNALRVQHELGLRIFRSLGYLVMSFDGRTGMIQSKWMSFPFFYCLLWLAGHAYIIYTASVERYFVINAAPNRSFDENLFLYSLYVFLLYEGLCIALILESKKIARYYNMFAEFQVRYYHVKGSQFTFPVSKFIQARTFLVFTSIFVILLASNTINVRSIYKVVDEKNLLPFLENLLSSAFIIMDLFALHYLWFYNMHFLQAGATVFVEEMRDVFKNGDDRLLDGYEKLWIDYAYIVKQMGNAFAYSIGYFFILTILISTFELWLTIEKDHVVVVIFGVTLSLCLLFFMRSGERLADKMTRHLRSQLVDVAKCATLRRRNRIRLFLRLMNQVGCSINIRGFAVLNFGLSSSIIKSITTYVIILLQFKHNIEVSNPNGTTPLSGSNSSVVSEA